MDKIDTSQGIERLLNVGSLLNSSTLKNTKAETRKTREKSGIGKSEFSQVLDRLEEPGTLGPLSEINPSQDAVQELIDAVHSTGNDFKRRPLPEEFLQYKRAIRNFLHYVVENGYELLESQGKKKAVRGKAEWRATIFHQVHIVDQKLNQLAEEMLTKQISELDLKSKIDDITGLLVDITVTGKIRERDE